MKNMSTMYHNTPGPDLEWILVFAFYAPRGNRTLLRLNRVHAHRRDFIIICGQNIKDQENGSRKISYINKELIFNS